MTVIGWLAPIVLTAVSAVAQAPAPPASQQTFHAGTVVVEVDAVVNDGKGQFVSGLGAADFEVLEDGKPQRIERVYLVDGGTIGAASRPSESQLALAPAPSAAPQRVFVLIFDQDHLEVGSFKRVKDAALEFLQKEFKDGDVGGIVIGNSMAGNKLTSDRETLIAAVRNAQPTSDKASRRMEMYDWPRLASEQEAIRIALANDKNVIDQAVRRACQDDPDICKKGVDPAPLVMDRARMIVSELRPGAKRTVTMLQTLASGLSRLPGRKSIILMTEGFFIEESWADLRQIVGSAARSNVRIYSLDARGLEARSLDLQQQNLTDPGGGMPLEAYKTSDDGPNMLAVDTGGYVIRHTNKFADALAGIARDASTYYVISYTPANATPDGSFRKISVRLKRGGLTVRARRGYLAVPPVMTAASPVGSDPTSGGPAPTLGSDPRIAGTGSDPRATGLGSDPNVPAPAGPAPTAVSGTVVAPGRSEPSGFALRPDSNGRVDELARRDSSPVERQTVASQGWDRYQKGDLEGASTLLGKAIAEPDAQPWVRYAFGYSELGLRHPELAVPEWEKVRAAAPDFQPVYLDLADAYMQMANYGRALDVLKNASTRWPRDTEVLNAAGTIQVRRGALDDAVATFKKATDSNPDESLGHFNLARTYELRYFKTRRYSQSDHRWLANSNDLKHALAGYEEYLKLGGPYETEARQAIQNLQWFK